MSHTHIGQDDWPCIRRMLRAGHSFSEIARTIGKDQSSLSRHVRKYGGRGEYDACEVRRRKRMKRIAAMESIRAIKGARLCFIKRQLKEHRSPEQISGILALGKVTLAASTIYRYLKERAPHLKKYLRSQKGKYRRRRGTKIREKQREQAKKRRIDERPRVVERRGRIGDFEGDTLMGRDKRVRIVSFVDRGTGYLVAFLLPKMNSELLTKLAAKHFRKIAKKKRRTITLDNGFENSDWQSLEEKAKVKTYFAHPYCSSERGANENANGLFRKYFPKGTDFSTISDEEITRVEYRLNTRPRKRLGWKSPLEAWSVALRG